MKWKGQTHHSTTTITRLNTQPTQSIPLTTPQHNPPHIFLHFKPRSSINHHHHHHHHHLFKSTTKHKNITNHHLTQTLFLLINQPFMPLQPQLLCHIPPWLLPSSTCPKQLQQNLPFLLPRSLLSLMLIWSTMLWR